MIAGVQAEVVVTFAVLETMRSDLRKELFQEAESVGLVIDGICQVWRGDQQGQHSSFCPGPLRRITVKNMWMASPLQDQDHVSMSMTGQRSS